jgi:SAM-dependent methyltransferase
MTTSTAIGPFLFACPECGTPLDPVAPDRLRCPAHGVAYGRHEGIWRFLPPAREQELAQFMREYQAVRHGEGRGDRGPAYYRALPFRDLSGRFADDWKIRAASFRWLVERLLSWEGGLGRSGTVLDLGAGCGWLAYRLAQRGHAVAAVDLQTNGADGLGAYVHYDAPFQPVQAEFDHLPFASRTVDLLIFNASLHYSTDCVVTLREALRVLRQGGTMVVLDSPLYRRASSGQAMVRQREAAFARRFGFPSNALASEHYLTPARLDQLAALLGVRWEITYPRHGLRFAIRRWRTRLRERREAARFPMIVARKQP